MIFAEVPEREAIQMPAVGGVAEGAEIRVMRRDDHSLAVRAEKPMKLFHRSNYVRYVLDHMNGAYLAEGAVGKRKRTLIEIGDHVGTRVCVAVNANRSGILVDSATYVENRQNSNYPVARYGCLRRDGRFRACRHSFILTITK